MEASFGNERSLLRNKENEEANRKEWLVLDSYVIALGEVDIVYD